MVGGRAVQGGDNEVTVAVGEGDVGIEVVPVVVVSQEVVGVQGPGFEADDGVLGEERDLHERVEEVDLATDAESLLSLPVFLHAEEFGCIARQEPVEVDRGQLVQIARFVAHLERIVESLFAFVPFEQRELYGVDDDAARREAVDLTPGIEQGVVGRREAELRESHACSLEVLLYQIVALGAGREFERGQRLVQSLHVEPFLLLHRSDDGHRVAKFGQEWREPRSRGEVHRQVAALQRSLYAGRVGLSRERQLVGLQSPGGQQERQLAEVQGRLVLLLLWFYLPRQRYRGRHLAGLGGESQRVEVGMDVAREGYEVLLWRDRARQAEADEQVGVGAGDVARGPPAVHAGVDGQSRVEIPRILGGVYLEVGRESGQRVERIVSLPFDSSRSREYTQRIVRQEGREGEAVDVQTPPVLLAAGIESGSQCDAAVAR